MGYEIVTTIDIEAAPETVWQVLTDLDAYAEWNPFIISSSGDLAVGERLENRMQPPGGRAMTFRPVVTVVDADRSFEWLGRLLLPGLFDGRHRFDLERTATGTRLTHRESFTGILVPLLKKSLDSDTKAGFEAMNEALRLRCQVVDAPKVA